MSPSVMETTLAGQEKLVAGMARKKNRRVRREQRMQVSPLMSDSAFNCLPQENQEINPGKITYNAVNIQLLNHDVARASPATLYETG